MLFTTGTLDRVRPRLRQAQETVVPAVAQTVAQAKGKSSELYHSDAMAAAQHRARNMLRAARGAEIAVPGSGRSRRWPVALGCFAGGTAIGLAAAVVLRRMAAPIPELLPDEQPRDESDEYVRTLPSEEPAPATP